MSTEVLLAGFAVITVVTAVQGSVGFGANLLAMPIMAQIDPDLVPGPTLFATALLNVLVVYSEREHVQFRPIGEALVGRVVGTILALGVVGSISSRGLGFIIVIIVLGGVALLASGVRAERTQRNMIIAGGLSGFGATTAGVGGPPVALLFADAPGPKIRASLGLYFLIGTAMTLSALAFAGRFGAEEVGAAVFFVPASILGYALSRPLSGVVDRGLARPAIMTLSIIAALTLLVRLVTVAN